MNWMKWMNLEKIVAMEVLDVLMFGLPLVQRDIGHWKTSHRRRVLGSTEVELDKCTRRAFHSHIGNT